MLNEACLFALHASGGWPRFYRPLLILTFEFYAKGRVFSLHIEDDVRRHSFIQYSLCFKMIVHYFFDFFLFVF